ncbi:MAG: VWA domain-containing protein [Microcystaceae cyanobacterium]
MLKVSYDFEPSILTSSSSQADILLRFRAEVPESPRRDLNLSIVIDRSGSMAGKSLFHALKAAESVVEQLTDKDILSVVVYDDHVNTVIPPQPVSDQTALTQAIRNVSVGGLTNLSGGWLQGCEYVQKELDSQKINRVLLLTDGHANVGIRDPKALTNTAQQKAEEGIITTTLGFAQRFNEDLLIGMARASKGNFYFIQSIDDATEVFNIELDSLRAVVGQNLKITVELADGVTLTDTLSLADIKGNEFNLGEIYEGEDKLLGISLNLTPNQPEEIPVMRLHYSADVIQDNVIQTITGTTEVLAKVGTIEEAALAISSETILEISYLKIAKAKETALSLAEEGKHKEGEEILRTLIKELSDRGLNEHFEIAEEIDQLDYFARRIAQKALGNAGRKELRDQTYQSMSRNRSDLTARGVTAGDEVAAMSVVKEVGEGVELICVREKGKLRVKVVSEGYEQGKNVQFPRAIRAENARYVVKELELSKDGSFYRAKGAIQRFAKPGEPDLIIPRTPSRRSSGTSKPSKAPPKASDLPTTDTVGDGILVQCVKAKSKLRARVVSDGYEPDWNMRFPRSIREEGMFYVVDEVRTGPDGKSYIACGEIKRFLQTTS